MDDLEKWVEYGEYIRSVRKEKGISMYSIEKSHDFSRQYWSRIELAKQGYALKPELVKRMAEILDINYLELYQIVGYVEIEAVIKFLKSNPALIHKIKDEL